MSTSPTELQKLWLALQRQRWNSLVVVPASPGTSALAAAQAILAAGAPYPEAGPLHLVDATAVETDSAQGLIREMRTRMQEGRAVVALDSPLTRPAGLPVALAADAALLAVSLGDTDYTTASRTLELVGRERFVGSVTFPRETKKKAKKK